MRESSRAETRERGSPHAILVTEELLLEAHEAVSKIAAAETLLFGSMAWRVTEVPRAGTRPRSTPRTRSTSGGSTCSSSSAFY